MAINYSSFPGDKQISSMAHTSDATVVSTPAFFLWEEVRSVIVTG